MPSGMQKTKAQVNTIGPKLFNFFAGNEEDLKGPDIIVMRASLDIVGYFDQFTWCFV
jgi:hypothetical protein